MGHEVLNLYIFDCLSLPVKGKAKVYRGAAIFCISAKQVVEMICLHRYIPSIEDGCDIEASFMENVLFCNHRKSLENLLGSFYETMILGSQASHRR